MYWHSLSIQLKLLDFLFFFFFFFRFGKLTWVLRVKISIKLKNKNLMVKLLQLYKGNFNKFKESKYIISQNAYMGNSHLLT